MRIFLIFSLVLLLLANLATVADAQILRGKDFAVTWEYPEVGTVEVDYGTYTVGDSEVLIQGQMLLPDGYSYLHIYDIHITDSEIRFEFYNNVFFQSANFAGFHFKDVASSIPDFTNVSIGAGTDQDWFDTSRFWFDSNNIYVNFAGLATDTANHNLVSLDISAKPDSAGGRKALPSFMLLLGSEGCALKQAAGSITTVPGENLIDGETVVISDGSNSPAVFEFDLGGDGVSAGNAALLVNSVSSADDVRDVIISAINSKGTSLKISASNGGPALVDLLNDTAGADGNQPISENVTDVNFVVTGMSGGCD